MRKGLKGFKGFKTFVGSCFMLALVSLAACSSSDSSPTTTTAAPPSTSATPAASGDLKMHMLSLDDGRNDSFIFELPNGEVMVLDNQDGDALIAKLGSLGIDKVKYVVGTHRHVDHIGGLDDFLYSDFAIDNTKIYYPAGAINESNSEFANLERSAKTRGLAIEELADGDYILNTDYEGKPLVIKALGPWKTRVDGGKDDYTVENDASLVLKITYGTKSILMMGDAKSTVESELMANENDDLDGIQILKIGHHGIKDQSEWSASDAFLDRLGVKKVLITNGTHDIAIHIVDNLQERGIAYWTTGQYGEKGADILFVTDGTEEWTTAASPYWKPGDSGTEYYFVEHAGDPKNTNGLRRLYNDTPIGDDVATADSQWGGYHIRWQLVDAGDGYYYIQNMKFGTRLYAESDGSDVYQAPGNTTSDNVKWRLTDADGTWKHVENAASRSMLSASPDDNWQVGLADKEAAGADIQWKWLPIPPGS